MSTLADSFGCSPPISCPGSDLPLLNLSSEGPDFPVFVGLNFGPLIPPPVLNHFSDLGCLSECDSTVSQQEADLCAARQSVFCVNGSNPNFPVPPPVCNTPQTATVTCPDGLPFSYTVPAGIFCGNSQTLVNEQAFAYAIQLANAQRVCLGSLQRCTCINQAYSSTIPISGTIGTVAWSIVTGALPPGLGLTQSGNIIGIPTINGTYSFTVQALTPAGTFMRKPFTIVVLQITTASLPNFTVGSAYSFQMQVVGGSGNYAWKITSGAFPDGLTMSVSGLISGTPTGVNFGSNPLVFSVIDTSCEAADQSFFPPIVTLSTSSTTRIATLFGWNEYGTPSSPPKKFHNLTWTGSAEQVCFSTIQTDPQVSPPVGFIADVRYVYSGTATIDTLGKQTSRYQKLMYTACPASTFAPLVETNVTSVANLGFLRGYCNTFDPASSANCSSCSFPPWPGSGFAIDFTKMTPLFVRDVSSNSTNDWPSDLYLGASFFINIVSTTMATLIAQPAFQPFLVLQGPPTGAQGLPISTLNDIQGFWCGVAANYNLTATLTNEFTDAEALANAQIIKSNGATAQTSNRTTGFVSTNTGVTFVLNFSNLIIGQAYVASVDFWDQPANTHTPKTYSFVATGATQSIGDTVPVPAQGHTIMVSKPKIAFVF